MNPDEKVVFAIAPHFDDADVLLGVSTLAWEYMKDGKTHTFDLTKLGLPIRIIMFGCADQAAALAVIEKHNATLGITETQDRRGEDFSIGPKG